MPVTDAQQRRGTVRLAPVLFWSGVGLAPLAALLLLVASSSGPIRLAATLAVLSVILVGLSITLRRDADSVRDELERLLIEEADALRDDVREDLTVAARATHKALGEKILALQQTVEALRVQVDYLRAQLGQTGPMPGLPQAATGPQADRVAAASSTGGVPGNGSASGHMSGAVGMSGGAGGRRGGGLVRHTETVQVTTRQTIVDQNESTGGRVYSASRRARAAAPAPRQEEWVTAEPRAGWVPPASREEWTPRGTPRPVWTPREPPREEWKPRESPAQEWLPRESPREEWTSRELPRVEQPSESWTEELLRERLAASRLAERGPDQTSGGRRRAYDPDDDDRMTGMRSGDRWAAVRDDDRGRELQMGERRTAMHADQHGTEVRIEDRWAAVRRAEARRGDRGWEPDRDRDRDSANRDRRRDDEDDGRWRTRTGDWATERRVPAALPPAPHEPLPDYARPRSPRAERQPERIPERRSRHADDRDDYERDDYGRDRDDYGRDGRDGYGRWR